MGEESDHELFLQKTYDYDNKTYNEAYNATQLWTKQHQGYLSITISDEEKGIAPFEHHENRLFHYSTENTYIILSFNKSINYSMSVDELKKNIKYISLQRIPLPNFVIPNRWHIYPRTLTDVIDSDKINIVSFENREIKIHAKADFVNICGKFKDIPFICGLTPKWTYFTIKNYLKSDIFIHLPIEIEN